MNNRIFTGILTCVSLLAAAACSSSGSAVGADSDAANAAATVHAVGYGSTLAMPKAVIYKTNGDYRDNVMIVVDPEHSQVVAYPAVSDVSDASSPIELGDGWLLDRRGGICPGSVFLNFTYSQYSALPVAPTHEQLLANIIPGSAVTTYCTLPISASEAIAHPELAKKYIFK